MTRRFVFGVDLDGVVTDYAAGFRSYVAALRGIEADELPVQTSYDFAVWGLDRKAFEHLHSRAVREQRIFAGLTAIEGAADALWRLSDAGVWIRVITHRLVVNWGHLEAVTDTVSWLEANRVPYRDICFLGNKPEVEADCYVDDAPENISALRAGGNYVIVFDQPYNRNLIEPRAHNWHQLEGLVMERFRLWRGEAGVQHQLPGIDAGSERLAHRRARSGSGVDAE